jgi:hypothetical protein
MDSASLVVAIWSNYQTPRDPQASLPPLIKYAPGVGFVPYSLQDRNAGSRATFLALMLCFLSPEATGSRSMPRIHARTLECVF